MIQLVDISLFALGNSVAALLHRANAKFPASSHTAIVSHASFNKSMLSQLLLKTALPQRGQVFQHGQLSPVLGNTQAFNAHLTGAENVQILARIMGENPLSVVAFVEQFCALGDDFYRPIRLISPIKKAMIGYAFSFAAHFPFYLAEDMVGTGDTAFKAKCEAMLMQKMDRAGMIFLTSNAKAAEKYCDRFYALAKGRFLACASATDAFELSHMTEKENTHDFSFV